MAGYIKKFYAFNRGLVSELAEARADLKRLALSASVFINWMPRVLGSMMKRPGLQYISRIRGDNFSTTIDFVFGTSDTGTVECTPGHMRVRIDDQIITRVGVTSAFYDATGGALPLVAGSLQSSDFADAADVARWVDNDQAGAASGLFAGGGLSLLGTITGTASAIRDRSVKVTGANIGKEHEITIVVARGVIVVRIGTSAGDDTYLESRALRTGTHSLAITPSGDFFIRLSSYLLSASVVESVSLRTTDGDMDLPTPWATRQNLDEMRWTQSGDVIFIACNGLKQMRIERQDRTNTPPSRSWSIVEYFTEDGPFGPINTGPIKLSASALSGDIDVTATQPFWKNSHIDAIFRLHSLGQTVEVQLNAAEIFSNAIRVTGIGSSRAFAVELTIGTWTTSIVTVERSIGEEGNWTSQATYSAAGTYSFNDLLDNQIIFYRIGIELGNYTPGDDITARLIFSAGSIEGIVRVRSITSNLVAVCSVLKALGGTGATQNWNEGDWSPRLGWPTAVALYGGRMFWAGRSRWWGSVSDLYDSFSDDVSLGDAGTIRGELGAGPVDVVNWMLGLNNLMIGADGEAKVAQSSSVTGLLTPTDKALKTSTDVGTAPMRAIKVDTQGIFVARNGSRVYELSADANLYSAVPYVPADLTALVPDIGVPRFRRIAVQRAKDTRIHAVRDDGKVAIMVRDKNENVNCWLIFETDGIVEDVCVLPGKPDTPLESQVYYTIRRVIDGVSIRTFEKWALESQAVGAADTRLVDSHVTGTAAVPTNVINLPHLPNTAVKVWGNGKDLGTFTSDGSGNVSGFPSITGPWCAGLAYTASWVSTKLTPGSDQNPLNDYLSIDGIWLELRDAHAQGLRMGVDPTFALTDGMPTTEDGEAVDPNYVWPKYDKARIPIEGSWDTDPRICLQSVPNRPVTVLGITIGGQGHGRT